MAESTFGRRAVNDGKFVTRLRHGGRVTTSTIERVRAFIDANTMGEAGNSANGRAPGGGRPMVVPLPTSSGPRDTAQHEVASPEHNFRFFDNRQKYLMFVNTCSEKWVVAGRVDLELANLRPQPPAIRVFDAGVGDGTVLTRVMRSLHRRFEHLPFYIVGKEISLEDVRLALEKLPDRFQEHPATVFIMTNLHYAEAPWLLPDQPAAAADLVWHEVKLHGDKAAEFDEQITELQPFLAANWRARVSRKSGNPIYEKPVVLVIYREDRGFLLDRVLPERSAIRADYDLVIASQPYRARASVEFKARRVIAPLVRSLAPDGRLIGIHSFGHDPGMEIVQHVWPGENPFQTSRQELLQVTKEELGQTAHRYDFHAYTDERAIFRYDMHTLPGEIDSSAASIGTSRLFAAWNAATYVAQIEDQRLTEAMTNDGYLEATREVLRARNGLWFLDESFVISRSNTSP